MIKPLFVPAQGAKDGGVDDGHGAREGEVGARQSHGRGRLGHVRPVQGATEECNRRSSGVGGGTREPNGRRWAVQRGKQLKADQTIFPK